MSELKKINVTVFRFSPAKDKAPRYVTYEVPYQEGMTVLSALNYIYENLDSTLSYQYSCREGLCHACDMLVNGAAVEACSTLVKGDIKVEPPIRLDRWGRGFKVIKDLVADDVLGSERDNEILSKNRAYESIQLLAREPTLNHAVVRYLKTTEGKNFSEENIAGELGISLERLRKILKDIQAEAEAGK